MSVKVAYLVHSFSMFQPSFHQPDQPTSSYKPPIFSSSCGSIAEDSRSRRPSCGLPTNTKRRGSRSHSISTINQSTKRNTTRSRSVGGLPPPYRLSTQGSHDGPEQKDSLGSIPERKSSVANISSHFSSLMSVYDLSSQVWRFNKGS